MKVKLQYTMKDSILPPLSFEVKCQRIEIDVDEIELINCTDKYGNFNESQKYPYTNEEVKILSIEK